MIIVVVLNRNNVGHTINSKKWLVLSKFEWTVHTSISQSTYIWSDRIKYKEPIQAESTRMYNQVEITLKPVHSEKPIYSYAHHQIIEKSSTDKDRHQDNK